ncbi:hypothetical protein COCMIDRAFT_98947, partial [Bipolaris oryzae ATCC 44560]
GWDCLTGIGAGLWMTSSAGHLSVMGAPKGWEEAFTCERVALATALGGERHGNGRRVRRVRQEGKRRERETAQSQDPDYKD